ncbi:hypothetical protein [Kitasatospora kifunensis]|uniref:Fe2OG dioxygenase domain-containing protein n=1 Tax=Kitasatospora kifunensis TaxID=58351 RepID=A0A7W7R7M4_KITKI|nr:hypothetical protein [Kitasatospora kifunensis]MBB4926917.1 hypothetical protein [Kitasatospora kifunensis]
MHETLRIGSIEGLLLPAELTRIRLLVADALGPHRTEFAVERRNRSVHRIDDESVDRAKEVYEPLGRIEFDELPVAIAEIAQRAILRRLDDILPIFPSVRRSMDWFYVEYAAGQFITPHADYPQNETDPDQPKVASVSLLIDSPESGGEFFVETFADGRVWSDNGLLQHGLDYHNDSFRTSKRTRWRTSVQAGDALCTGTQVIHGTEPVGRGVASKLIGFLGS